MEETELDTKLATEKIPTTHSIQSNPSLPLDINRMKDLYLSNGNYVEKKGYYFWGRTDENNKSYYEAIYHKSQHIFLIAVKSIIQFNSEHLCHLIAIWIRNSSDIRLVWYNIHEEKPNIHTTPLFGKDSIEKCKFVRFALSNEEDKGKQLIKTWEDGCNNRKRKMSSEGESSNTLLDSDNNNNNEISQSILTLQKQINKLEALIQQEQKNRHKDIQKIIREIGNLGKKIEPSPPKDNGNIEAIQSKLNKYKQKVKEQKKLIWQLQTHHDNSNISNNNTNTTGTNTNTPFYPYYPLPPPSLIPPPTSYPYPRYY